MWSTRKIFSGIYKYKIKPEKRFEKDVPDWPGFDRWAETKYSKIAWAAVYAAIYILFAPSPWFYLLLPLEILTGPVQGAIINWYAHKYGYKNFKLNNTSTNLIPVDFLMLGEAYHNDHHKNPSGINFGVKWYEIDPVYYAILLFNKLGIIKLSSKAVVFEEG
jgi:stearoyl-CoA desaturase (delta-9 desaturase)